MLCREIIAVCSQIHTKHINTLCGQNAELLNVNLAVHTVTTVRYIQWPQGFRGFMSGIKFVDCVWFEVFALIFPTITFFWYLTPYLFVILLRMLWMSLLLPYLCQLEKNVSSVRIICMLREKSYWMGWIVCNACCEEPGVSGRCLMCSCNVFMNTRLMW